jgi:lipopolysaccharide/colanic/teichoic acid biosynthesis glycosyltransferase
MRSSHIDELPQLLNVIKGDMSLVGPRPERPEIVEELLKLYPDFSKRLAVRPGITGLAQVRSGYSGSTEGAGTKLVSDLEYIKQRKWALELRILAATLRKLRDPEAH